MDFFFQTPPGVVQASRLDHLNLNQTFPGCINFQIFRMVLQINFIFPDLIYFVDRKKIPYWWLQKLLGFLQNFLLLNFVECWWKLLKLTKNSPKRIWPISYYLTSCPEFPSTKHICSALSEKTCLWNSICPIKIVIIVKGTRLLFLYQ